MDILRKAVLLIAILSISVFVTGCGGEEAADEGGAETSGGAGLDNLEEMIETVQEEAAAEEAAAEEETAEEEAAEEETAEEETTEEETTEE